MKKICVLILFLTGTILGLAVWWLSDRSAPSSRETFRSPVRSVPVSRRQPLPQIAANAEDQVPLVRQSVEAVRLPQVVPTAAKEMLRSRPEQEATSAASSSATVRLAAEKSQLMDDLLNEEPIPSDYGQVMVGLFRDRSQDVYTRDFAVQHIGPLMWYNAHHETDRLQHRRFRDPRTGSRLCVDKTTRRCVRSPERTSSGFGLMA